MTRALWEVRLEVPDQALDLLPDRWEGVHPQPTLAERYLDGQAAFHVHVGLRSGDVESKVRYVHAIFERFPEPHGIELEEKLCADGVAAEAAGSLFGVRERPESGVDRTVLVGIAVGVKNAKSTRGRVHAYRVRLHAFDEVDVLLASATYPLGPLCPEVLLPAEDRKADELTNRRGHSATEPYELVGEVVQRGAQIVERIAEDEPEPKWGRLGDVGAHDEEPFLLVELMDDRQRLTIHEGFEFLVESFKMFVRPVQPCEGVS